MNHCGLSLVNREVQYSPHCFVAPVVISPFDTGGFHLGHFLHCYSSKVRTFVEDIDNPDLSLKCYSENLHLFQSGSKPKTSKL
ncbi:hypothetical protein AVEN_24187-1, partial [Araneus ventricosus]